MLSSGMTRSPAHARMRRFLPRVLGQTQMAYLPSEATDGTTCVVCPSLVAEADDGRAAEGLGDAEHRDGHDEGHTLDERHLPLVRVDGQVGITNWTKRRLDSPAASTSFWQSKVPSFVVTR